MSDSPDVIYLQWIPEKTWYDDQVTWCEDRINDDDVEYIKKSTATLRLELLRRLEFVTNDDGQTVVWMWLQKDELEGLVKELADAHGRL